MGILLWREQDQSCRESDIRAYWLNRNHRILDWLLCEKSSIICLQVFYSSHSFAYMGIVNFYQIGGKKGRLVALLGMVDFYQIGNTV